MSLERNRKTETRKSEMVSRIQMTAAGQRIFFHQRFAFQRTRLRSIRREGVSTGRVKTKIPQQIV